MTNNSKHIILTSSNSTLVSSVAHYLFSEFGFHMTPLENLHRTEQGAHGVSIITDQISTDLLDADTFSVNVDDLFAESIEDLGAQIFDKACDFYLGAITEEELLACA